VAITPDNRKVYVTNQGSGTVSVIDTETRQVMKTITVGPEPLGRADPGRKEAVRGQLLFG